MRPRSFTITASAGGTTYSPAYPIDGVNNPCCIAIGVVGCTGSALYDVQHTFSSPWSINLNANPTANTLTTGLWENNATLTSASTDGDTNYAFPPRAVRLALRAAASATATIKINQAGPEN